jgi:hypothetical protein
VKINTTIPSDLRVLRFREHRKKGDRAGKGMAPYRCPACKRWHIGSDSNNRRRK